MNGCAVVMRQFAKALRVRCVLAAILVLLGAASACTASHPGAAGPSGRSASPTANALNLATLLRLSWATNGSVGFFVESADIAQSMSLYSTRWWLDILTATHGGDASNAGLDVAAVRGWVSPFASGQNVDGGDAATLPALERIDDAVDILKNIGVQPDQPAVARALESLRRGDQYEAQPGGTGDWADTAFAVSLYRAIGLSPPAAVADALAKQVPRAIDDRHTADILSFTVPVIASLSTSGVAAQADLLRTELNWIQAQQGTLPVLARISIATSLKPVVRSLGAPPWNTDVLCSGLGISPDGVTAIQGTSPDPQLTAQALSLGCIKQQALPPWSPAGWPNSQAISASLPSSVDGMRVATFLEDGSKYADSLRAELQRVWVPAFKGQPTGPESVAADLMAGQLGLPLIVAPSANDIRDALATNSSNTVSELLVGLDAYPAGIVAPTVQSIGAAAVTPTGGASDETSLDPLTNGVVDELKARLTHVATEHVAALAVLSSLRTGPSLYASAPGGSTSLTATMIAAWITGTKLPTVALERARICQSEYACTGGNPPTAIPELQVAAAVVALATPAANQVPISF